MIEEEIARRARLEALRQQGVDPYPASAKRSHHAETFNALFRDLLASREIVTVVGRILAIRKHGGMTFLVVGDESGQLQVALKKDDLGEAVYQSFHDAYDRGDFIEVSGTAYLTKTEEPTVMAQSFRLLTKSLLPLPEKWHGLSDTEIRYRQRYLDLASNPNIRAIFKMRSAVVRAIRSFLDAQNFIEVETPILQPIAGGAEAEPFVTNHNALGADLFLRIAPELYLKRCLVGGFERVYEVSRCFRNEGISFQHNPEFTQVEGYIAYAGLDELIDHLEGLIGVCVKAATGGETVVKHEQESLDFTAPIRRVHFYDLILSKTGIDLQKDNTEATLRLAMKKKGFAEEGIVGFGGLADELWKKEVRPEIIQPTFVTNYPAAMKPLAKRSIEHPEMSSNVQLVVKGQEIVNAFSELNDPLEQEQSFLDQEVLRERGREEAFAIDHDYIEALKIGMPPAAGYGVGIDRLCAILAGTRNIKEVILFPTLKPEQADETV
ncbi:MAG: lysine--tRNA ligase [Patescibacteria group bacterium]